MTFHIGTPFAKGAGYLVNNRDLRTREESHIRTCSHCQAVIKLEEWKEDGGWCSRCNAPVCSEAHCVAQTAKLGCIPFIKLIEAEGNARVKLAQHLKIAGLDPPATPRSLIIPG